MVNKRQNWNLNQGVSDAKDSLSVILNGLSKEKEELVNWFSSAFSYR